MWAAKVASVDGIPKEIPEVMNGQMKLCVTFESNTSGDKIVIFAHRVNDSEKLSAYHLNLNGTNCTTAPAPGSYFFGVFTNGGNTLNEPATPPTISLHIVPASECTCVQLHSWSFWTSVSHMFFFFISVWHENIEYTLTFVRVTATVSLIPSVIPPTTAVDESFSVVAVVVPVLAAVLVTLGTYMYVVAPFTC